MSISETAFLAFSVFQAKRPSIVPWNESLKQARKTSSPYFATSSVSVSFVLAGVSSGMPASLHTSAACIVFEEATDPTTIEAPWFSMSCFVWGPTCSRLLCSSFNTSLNFQAGSFASISFAAIRIPFHDSSP